MKRTKEQQRLQRILSWFPRVQILVVGDVMMDRSILGKVSRISPEAPVPVMVVEREDFDLGGAANVAHNIHSLGGKVSLCSVVGDDENGKKMLGRMAETGIQTEGIFTEQGRRTTVKTRIIAHHPHHQQLVRIDRETLDHPGVSTLRNLGKFLATNIEKVDGIIISDYGKGLLTRKLIQDIIRRARKSKKLIMVDPKVKNFFSYKRATVITPNMQEVSDAARVSVGDRPSLERVGRKLLRRLKCEVLVITRGEEGMTIFEPRREPIPVPTVAKEVFDVTGAGDTVIGTMALALGAGAGVIDAANLANCAAGVAVGKRGTATVTREELMRAIQSMGGS